MISDERGNGATGPSDPCDERTRWPMRKAAAHSLVADDVTDDRSMWNSTDWRMLFSCGWTRQLWNYGGLFSLGTAGESPTWMWLIAFASGGLILPDEHQEFPQTVCLRILNWKTGEWRTKSERWKLNAIPRVPRTPSTTDIFVVWSDLSDCIGGQRSPRSLSLL